MNHNVLIYLFNFANSNSARGNKDCATCGPKVTSKDDVADVEIPLWKKKALSKGLDDVNAAPFGMSDWKTEASVSAAKDEKGVNASDTSHS